jgi:serine/threonine-protein kinase
MLNGLTVFGGATVSDTLASVLKEVPDLDLVPSQARTLVRYCLEKDPRRRMRDIGDARLLLKDAQEMTAAPPVQVSRRPVALWSLLGAVVLIAAALGAGLWRATRPTDRPLMWISVDLGPDARAGRDFTAAISPDGTRLVFPIGDPGASRLAVRSLGQPNATPLAGTEGGATNPRWRMGRNSAPAAS